MTVIRCGLKAKNSASFKEVPPYHLSRSIPLLTPTSCSLEPIYVPSPLQSNRYRNRKYPYHEAVNIQFSDVGQTRCIRPKTNTARTSWHQLS